MILSSLLLAVASAQASPVCTSGELFAGAPEFDDPMLRASDGQKLRDVPPLGFRSLLFAGDRLVTTTGQELWYSDLSASEPVVTRLAGKEDRRARASRPGACAAARFANIGGIALLPDGRIAGTDQTANNLFLIQDPFGSGCKVSLIAGVTAAQDPVNPGHPASVGDVDGPGAGAKLGLPTWMAADGDRLYFVDPENAKIKRVAIDPGHSVTTVATLPDGVYFDMVALGGKLYLVGNNAASEGFILAVDPATGEVRDVLRGRSDTWLGSGAINLSGLATDGTGLFTSQSGRLLYVTLDGEVEQAAGAGKYFEFDSGYDPAIEHPASELQLRSSGRTQTAGANVFLAYRDGHVYYSAAGSTAYVERIACQSEGSQSR